MLDNRLKICADFVSGRGIAVDVGTDHAHLAAELINSGRCRKVIASDINEGPLESARKTVEKHGISDRVELVLSDGLENVCLDGVTDIVIAGMGGETIADIIRAISIFSDDIRLILQPMSKPELLRKMLYENHFEIVEEKGGEVGDKLYTVICAVPKHENHRLLTEYEAIAGFFSDDDVAGKKIRQKEAERLGRIAVSLDKSGKTEESLHYSSLSLRVAEGTRLESQKDVFEFINERYPLSLQEKWDNSGWLVRSMNSGCRKILLALDITNDIVCEARRKGTDMIISHHPVIFEPLRSIRTDNPVYHLIRNDISALCIHTNLDIAEGGTNSVIARKIAEKVGISGNPQALEELGNGSSLGCIIELSEKITKEKFTEILKEIFGCQYIRINSKGKKCLSKIAVCSGSGGSLAEISMAKGCDALVTGDVKHDVWITANNTFFTIFDCGHFHTENLVLEELRYVLEKKFPQLDVEISENSTDPTMYF